MASARKRTFVVSTWSRFSRIAVSYTLTDDGSPDLRNRGLGVRIPPGAAFLDGVGCKMASGLSLTDAPTTGWPSAIAEVTARDMKAQNIRCAEMFFSPSLVVRHGLAVQRLPEAFRAGLDRVSGMIVAFVADLVRDYGPESEARKLAQLLQSQVGEASGLVRAAIVAGHRASACRNRRTLAPSPMGPKGRLPLLQERKQRVAVAKATDLLQNDLR